MANNRTMILAGLGAVALMLSACSGASEPGSNGATENPGGGDSPSTEMCTMTDEQVELNYWTWGAGYEEAANLWNETHPNVHVTFGDIPVGNAGGYQKIFTALTAGEAPDVIFVEFDNVPAFVTEDALLDVAPLLGADATSDFIPSLVDQVSLTGEGSMDMVPLGGGPMALYYRADLFEANGIEVPTTWQEFAEAAAKVREVDPNAYLANFDGGGNANWFAGLVAQNAGQWFAQDGGQWTVSIDSPESVEVAAFWEDLLVNDQVSALATFSPEWNAALAEGQIWSWPSAVWGAGVIQASAPDLSGNWSVATLPSWGADTPVSASWGGGGLAVVNTTEHPCEAAQFAYWMGTDVEAMRILNAAVGIWPTTSTLMDDPLFAEPNEYFGGQAIYQVFKDADAGLASFVWGPQMTDTYASVTDAFTKPLTEGGQGLADSLSSANQTAIDAMKRNGFEVSP